MVEDSEPIETDIQVESVGFTEEIVNRNFLTIQKESSANTNRIVDDLMPLEFCFVLEKLEIEPAKEFDVFEIEFDLELSSEKTKAIANKPSEEVINISKDERGLSEEEHTFFQKLLEFPSTINDIFNG